MVNKRKIPLRKCTGCGEMKNKKELIRIVKSEEGAFSMDFTGKKPGRGAYICFDVECLKKARKTKGLDRSYKQSVPSEVYDELEAELENRSSSGE